MDFKVSLLSRWEYWLHYKPNERLDTFFWNVNVWRASGTYHGSNAVGGGGERGVVRVCRVNSSIAARKQKDMSCCIVV